jgi:hypothetical protein
MGERYIHVYRTDTEDESETMESSVISSDHDP